MRRWIFIVLLLMASSMATGSDLHTLNAALRAVEQKQADTQVLVYKVRDQNYEIQSQNWRPFLSRQAFNTTPLFRQLSQSHRPDMRALSRRTQQNLSEFGRYFVRRFPQALNEDGARQALAEMYADRNIEFAYFEPRLEDAVHLERMAQNKAPAQQELGDFEAQQFHLNPAPEGIDARAAWALPGGTGKGIRMIDVETGWHLDHFEFGPIFYDNGKNGLVDHGTAVWGQVAARPDGRGITGIAYDVEWGIAGNGFTNFDEFPVTIAAVIEGAVLQLQAGDIILIEQHAPLVDDFGPIEFFEPVFKVLQLATAKGVHCIAVAGNGYSNLDDEKYNGVFDLKVRDSGCVLVAAVDSPLGPGVRQRSGFSNYGTRVDTFSYGEDVVTAGYGDLFDGQYQGKLASYTQSFSGTSSAAPIVAGAVASLLGIAKHKGVVITPLELRKALRATGTQAARLDDLVGTMPNLPELIEYFGLNVGLSEGAGEL